MKNKTIWLFCFLCLATFTAQAQDIIVQEETFSINGIQMDHRWHTKPFIKALGKPKRKADMDIYPTKGIELFINPEDSEVESLLLSYNYKLDTELNHFTNDYAGKLIVQGVEINGDMTLENFMAALPQYNFQTDDKGIILGQYKSHIIFLDYDSSNKRLIDIEIAFLEDEDLKK
jgi:hypothetical protein